MLFKGLRTFLDKQAPLFEKGGRWHKFYSLYEALDTFLYTPGKVTTGTTHVRDGMDLKRMMVTVALALFPCILMAMYNTGYQAFLVAESSGLGTGALSDWRLFALEYLGLSPTSEDILACTIYGSLYFVPIYLVTNMVGGLWEALFASVRGHEINEGFLVTGLLFPLTLPAGIPLWQVALGISFGVIFGKELFGGTGKNFLNPALTGRAFLFFAYPAQISGDRVWVAVDGHSGATALSQAATGGTEAITGGWGEAFLGLIPGSMGETSTLACLLGAAYLILTGIGSWKIMVSVTLATVLSALFFNVVGSDTNPLFSLPPHWHLVLGGFAFGTIFMATDPVSATMTEKGKWFYGALIGVMVVLVRVVNPAFPEGMMLAILFANVFAPLIDHFAIQGNIKRRRLRS
ncbi:MAG: NADH:ubiquinone reductase (Na(+)-transporting) subunit B [Bacteriovoracales bacterium]|nr:NADH:ubiquinone reductase (Na(+)-transporting) subunit B [Bacteriovoracales bacterium]